ncbi:MAG: hypothetical protein L0211_23720 [Planctomycetaceae bacterium]|nr:hypothetical protein [Planctomycetaceae bacterium]
MNRVESQGRSRSAVMPAAALALCAALALSAVPAAAQYRDDFESPQATWTLKASDCGVKLLAQERTYRESRGGQASEHIRLAVGNGTFVYLTQSIGRAPVIAEFRPSVFVKADRANVQLLARVVFPRSIDRGSGQPITAFLPGDAYTDVGQWQQLAVGEVDKLLAMETRSRLTTFGPSFDAREAYVDLLVINAYSAPGNIDLWIDDLEIQGYVNLDDARGQAGPRTPVAGINTQRATIAPTGPIAQLQGSLLLVHGRPIAPRVIQHQGEPLDWLKSLGFNVVKLSASPSERELREAQRLGLWLIAPPPYRDEAANLEAFGPVIGWSLGSRLTARDVAGTQELVDEIRRFEPNPLRLVLAGTDSGLAELSRIAPLLVLDRNPLGTSQELAGQRSWLLARPRLARPGTPFWATVATERPARLTEQLSLLSRGAATDDDVDPDQLRLAAYSALAAGARGLVFSSHSPLAIDTGPASLRTDALKLLNLELQMLQPWIAAGTFAEELAAGDGSVQASVLATDRSRLLLITQHAPAQQLVLGPTPRSSLSVTVPGLSVSDRAYRVSAAGVKQLRISHSGSGATIAIDDAGLTTAVVITQDPLAVHHLGRTLAEIHQEAGRLRYDIAVRRLVRTEEIDGELAAAERALPAAAAWLRDAHAQLDQARRQLESNDYENLHVSVTRAEQALAKARRGHWEQTAGEFPSPAASPCLAQFTSLPLHWEVARRMQQGQFGPNEQAAGDMESLDAMLGAGWRQERRPPPGVKCDVSLSLQNPRSGRSALRMQAWIDDAKAAPHVLDEPVVLVTSSPVPVRQGQIVRVHAWVHVPKPLTGSLDGLVVFDSVGGPELGDRVRTTQGWRELTLYRAVGQTGQMQVTFALTGLGEGWVDDLAVSVLDPQPIRPVGN